MQVPTVTQVQNNNNFCGIYYKEKRFSKQQKQLIRQIKCKLNYSRNNNSRYNLLNYYKDQGFDFVVKPDYIDSITVYTTNRFSFLRWFFKDNYSDYNMFKIGSYNKSTIKDFRRNLDEQTAMFNIMKRE